MKYLITTLPVTLFNKHLNHSIISVSYYKLGEDIIRAHSTQWGIYEASFVNTILEEASSIEPLIETLEENDTIKILLVGTEFQRKIWQTVLQIPRGKIITYKSLAQLIQSPQSFRAVAGALAQNKIAYFIPCHRVIYSNGALGGYKWGICKKAALLACEGFTISTTNSLT